MCVCVRGREKHAFTRMRLVYMHTYDFLFLVENFKFLILLVFLLSLTSVFTVDLLTFEFLRRPFSNCYIFFPMLVLLCKITLTCV